MAFTQVWNRGGRAGAGVVQKGCPVCGWAPERPRFVWQHPAWGRYQTARCAACAMDYTDRPFQERTMAPNEGYWGVLEVYEGLPEENEAEARAYLAMVQRFATGGRLLDIGCGYGYFLDVAQRSGWDVAGFDVSPRAVEVAAASVGADRIQVAVAGSAVYEPERFDVITMWNVIEHMGTPRANVQRIVEWLKPGGYLIVETPNADSLIRAGSALLYRVTAGRFGLVPMLYEATEGGHVQIFSTRALERLLAPLGMSTVACERLNSPVPTLLAKNTVGDPRLIRTGKRLALQMTNGLATVSSKENRIRMVFRRGAGTSQ